MYIYIYSFSLPKEQKSRNFAMNIFIHLPKQNSDNQSMLLLMFDLLSLILIIFLRLVFVLS